LSVAAVLRQAAEQIERRDAEVLMAHVLRVTRAALFAYPEKQLSALDYARFQDAQSQCAEGAPVAYITGSKEFWSMTLAVTPDTLIPRPETECLVEAVLMHVTSDKALVADCGTGSGAIALALAQERPAWDVVATDCSEKALVVAKKNAAHHHINSVSFYQGNWCAALPMKSFDAIVSNPPYIAEKDPHLLALRHEPIAALVAGSDGLEAIREIVASAGGYLVPGGWLFIEHGYDQGARVQALFVAAGFERISTEQDFSGKDRVTLGSTSLII
jgi:release factor glutamine methyltransferase